MANEIITLILAIFVILVIGGLIGWAIAKLRFKSWLKKLDKKVNSPEEKLRLEKLKKEQETSTKEREVNQNDRRRKLYGNFGNGKPETGKSGIEAEIKQYIDKGRNEGQDKFQNTGIDKIGKSESGIEESDRSFEEDEREFDWHR